MPLGDCLILPISVLFGTEDRITCQELYNISKDRLQDTYSSESFSSMSQHELLLNSPESK